MPASATTTTHVDYFTHKFDPLDLHSCWKNATKNKNNISNGRRLENASWRKFFQLKYKLKTISPSKLNWFKDTDVSWLYGPFYSFKPLKVLEAEEVHQAHSVNLAKSALKRKTKRDFFEDKRAISNVDCLLNTSLIKPSHSNPDLSKLVGYSKSRSLKSNKVSYSPPETMLPILDIYVESVEEADEYESDGSGTISFCVIPKHCANKSKWLESHVLPPSPSIIKKKISFSESEYRSTSLSAIELAGTAQQMNVDEILAAPEHVSALMDSPVELTSHHRGESNEDSFENGVPNNVVDSATNVVMYAITFVTWAKDCLFGIVR